MCGFVGYLSGYAERKALATPPRLPELSLFAAKEQAKACIFYITNNMLVQSPHSGGGTVNRNVKSCKRTFLNALKNKKQPQKLI